MNCRGTDGVGSRSNPSDMILIDMNSEYGSAVMDFLALDKAMQEGSSGT